jgi:hypothetical protein
VHRPPQVQGALLVLRHVRGAVRGKGSVQLGAPGFQGCARVAAAMAMGVGRLAQKGVSTAVDSVLGRRVLVLASQPGEGAGASAFSRWGHAGVPGGGTRLGARLEAGLRGSCSGLWGFRMQLGAQLHSGAPSSGRGHTPHLLSP